MNKTFDGVLPHSILSLSSTYSFTVDINRKPLIIHAGSFPNSTQYLRKQTLFPFTLVELHLGCKHLELLRVKALGFGTLMEDYRENNPFPLNPVMVTWRHFMDNYIGRIEGMNIVRLFR